MHKQRVLVVLCGLVIVLVLSGCEGSTANSNSSVTPIDSQVTVPSSNVGSMETPSFDTNTASSEVGGGSDPQLSNSLDLDAQAGYNPYTVDPSVDNPEVPTGSGQTKPVANQFSDDIAKEPDFLTNQKGDEFTPTVDKTSGTEYVDSWMKNKTPSSGTAVTPDKPSGTEYVDSWMKNKTPSSGTAVTPDKPSGTEYVDSWMKNKTPSSGTAVTPDKPSGTEYVDSWMKNANPSGGTAVTPDKPSGTEYVDSWMKNKPPTTQIASLPSQSQPAVGEKYDPVKDPNRPAEFGEGGTIHRAQKYWDSIPDYLDKEVEAGRMGPLEATARYTGAKVLSGLLRLSNLGNVEKSAGELGYDVGAGADKKQLAKDGLKLTGHSLLAATTFLPAAKIGKAGTLMKGKNAGKFSQVTIHVHPEQYDKIVKGGGLIPTAEGRIFGTEYASLLKSNGQISRVKQIGSGLTNPSARVDKVVLRGDVLQHFERITPGGVIGASKNFGGQIVSSKIGHNLKFDPRNMIELVTRDGGRKLIVCKGEMEKAAFKQYLWAQARQVGTVAKEGALTAPPIVIATDKGIEYFTGEENVILRPAYEATEKGLDKINEGIDKFNNSNNDIYNEAIGP